MHEKLAVEIQKILQRKNLVFTSTFVDFFSKDEHVQQLDQLLLHLGVDFNRIIACEQLDLFAKNKALFGGDTFDYRIECNSERLIKVPIYLNGFIVKSWNFIKQYECVDKYGVKTYYDYLPFSSDNVSLKEFLILSIKIRDK